MVVTNLDYMESIVSSRHDLEWDGWNVIKYTKDPNGFSSVDGVFRKGMWFKKRVFPLTEKGWAVPENIGRSDAKMEG
jgi:hypothetical protein